MLSIVDVSKTILYYEEKQHSDFLSLINATVSHELRNPLNSIYIGNYENQKYYESIKTILNQDEVTIVMKNQLLVIMEKLCKGQRTLFSSTKIMKNLIQDLLDFTQIKAGKFRMNLASFNIRDTIQEIQEIQKRQAESKNITLTAEFNGIALSDENGEDEVL